MLQSRLLLAVVCLAIAGRAWCSEPADAAGADAAEAVKLFQSDVRRILTGRCLKCHGVESVEAGLDLTTREGLIHGSENGPVVVVGESAASRLVKLIRHEEEPYMPEDGAQLDKMSIAAIARWIDLGAPYDRPLGEPDADEDAWTHRKIDPAARQFWSFQPLTYTSLDKLPQNSWCRTPIDRFVLAKLFENGLKPNPPADRRTLIRRAYFDLLGLPPTADEIESFVQDPDREAYARLVDRLLASPHYGERWGRHWLDVARFAESHGFEQDYDRPHAFHYRDFVIKALNADLPYDQFVRWQLAGDEIAPDEPWAMMATGFLGAGVFPTQLTEKEFESARYDELDDMASTLGTALLGLTIGCARCHDHKFDPIPSADYYRLISALATTIRSNIELEVRPGVRETVMVTSEGLPPIKHHADERGFPHFYPQVFYLERGDPAKKRRVASPGYLQVLTNPAVADDHWHQTPPEEWRTSYRRRALANWLTDTQDGAGHLLARVIVNRLWQHHLGRGIVATPNDFGYQGARPTHPDLLDWLATQLIKSGWHLKPIHRLIMTSSVYMQTSEWDERRAQQDPQNTWYWRRDVQRLEAETIRDALLAASGLCDGTMYGPGTLDPMMRRRSVYFMIKRSKLIPLMQVFDSPEPLVSVGQRPTTTVSSQALLLMNHPLVRQCAAGLAQRSLAETDASVAHAVRHSYITAIGRPPDARELEDAVTFVRSQTAYYEREGAEKPQHRALVDFCHVLLCLNEFVYVD